ncbi:MAG: enoyl-CoA hydratase-related protein [Asticcacaulis sp.]
MSDISTETAGGVMRLGLNRPGKKNALTKAMYTDLTVGLTAAGADETVSSVIISAAGDDFCAGNDIFDFAQEFPAMQASGRAARRTARVPFPQGTDLFRKAADRGGTGTGCRRRRHPAAALRPGRGRR